MKKPQHFIVLSNISVEPFFVPALHDKLLEQGIVGKITYIAYQEYQEVEYQDVLKNAVGIVVWINLEALLPELHNGVQDHHYKEQRIMEVQRLCQYLAENILMYSNASIFWLLFEDYFLHLPMATGHRWNLLADNINQRLQEVSEQITFIDLKYLIAELGVELTFSARNKFRWNFPYSKLLVMSVADEILKQYYIENGISKKCLVLDCDNVLWGGVLSEDGMENIKLGSSGFGREYQEFQRFVLSLYYRGVIIAISSKNDLVDVLQVFRQHSGMVLKEEHIACFQVDWENKPDNIRRIAEKLNIGIESMVFVDDSSLEIEAIKAILPDVTAIRYNRENMYREFSCFSLKEQPDYKGIAKRNETYRMEVFRDEAKKKSSSYSEYLSMLEIKVDIHETQFVECARIAELTQRTNKCTNGIRCTIADVKEWVVCEYVYLYTITLADKFSDMGIVGVLGVQNDKLVLFSLSCRALGFRVEHKMLAYIQERYRIRRFDFIDTGKNEDLRKLFLEIFSE